MSPASPSWRTSAHVGSGSGAPRVSSGLCRVCVCVCERERHTHTHTHTHRKKERESFRTIKSALKNVETRAPIARVVIQELIEAPSHPLATSISNPLPTLGVEATLGVNVGTFVRRTSEGRVDTYKPIRPRAATTQPLYTVEPTTVKQAPAPHHTTLIL